MDPALQGPIRKDGMKDLFAEPPGELFIHRSQLQIAGVFIASILYFTRFLPTSYVSIPVLYPFAVASRDKKHLVNIDKSI